MIAMFRMLKSELLSFLQFSTGQASHPVPARRVAPAPYSEAAAAAWLMERERRRRR